MLETPTSMNDGWLASLKSGPHQFTSRVTIQRMDVKLLNYDLTIMGSTTLQGSGQFASMPFGQSSVPVELRNLKTVTWTRNLSQFAANGTVTITNTEALDVGILSDEGEFERPGVYSYQRGDSAEAFSRWGYAKNSHNGLVVPDRLIHIYQGYGTDGIDTPPEQDSKLVKTFTGLIDTVILNSDKTLTINFRDLSRALLDTIAWPDVVPWNQYPLTFDTFQKVDGPPVTSTTTSGKWVRPKYQTDSNKPYVGKGISDGGRPYVSSDGGINGHLGKHAFDSSGSSYWLSVGNYRRWSSAFEYVQGTIKKGSVSQVKITAYGGPYTVYVSLKNNSGDWQGNHKIPYGSRQVDTGADIKFVHRFTIGKGETKTINLPKVYSNITAVRITLTDLWDSNIGKYQYRAGLKDVHVYESTSLSTTTVPKITVGNINDYTSALCWILAWGGFFWPRDNSGFSFVTHSNGDKINYTHSPEDLTNLGKPVLPHGRIWGDLMFTGTSPISELRAEQFDKIPLADCISRIKEIIGFNFFVDETGGAVWRLPNIYTLGNYVSGATGGPNTGRTSDYVTVDEETTLIGLSSTVDSKNVRERVFVGNIAGNYGVITSGFNPYPSGLRRYGGWSDTNFKTQKEAKVMADFITLRQFMTYRQSTMTIAANPAIQIDDQIKVYEKVTSDTYFHYVNGIVATHDISTGRATYDLQTSWLGEAPGTRWVVDQNALDALTKSYLSGLGALH